MSSSPERWRFLEKLYRAAVERPDGERAALLREACSDEDLRREVESLLRFEGRGDTFMQQSPWAQSPGLALASGRNQRAALRVWRTYRSHCWNSDNQWEDALPAFQPKSK